MRKVLFTGFCVVLLGIGFWFNSKCLAWLKDSQEISSDLEYQNRAEVVNQTIFHPVKLILANGSVRYVTRRDFLKNK